MFADAYAAYGTALAENGLVLVLGNVLAGNDGTRLNIKECYPLDGAIAGLVRRVTWLVHPDHPELPAFLRLVRDTLNTQTGDTRVGLPFSSRTASRRSRRRTAPRVENFRALFPKAPVPPRRRRGAD